jgi:precorrin-2 dehydrogenase/sirohydrochlorin ferrochelatase
MRYYPINLDIQGRRCLVVGGGAVGTRKVKTLLECGAVVTVVSLQVTENLLKLNQQGKLVLKKRAYRAADLDRMFLVIGATDNEELNRQVSSDAERLGKLCNIADRPKSCNFILPSIVNRGDLVITVSTSGKSPAFAKKIRKDLENQFGQEYAEFLHLMGRIRKKLLSAEHEPEAHKPIFEKLINAGLIDMIRNRKTNEINSLLFETLGEGYDFDALMQASYFTNT